MRSIFPASEKPSSVEAALKLGRRALGAERDLEAARDERRLGRGLVADEAFEVPPEPAL